MAPALRPTYSYELRASVHPATLRAYALPWQFDGRRAYVHLCGRSVASLEPSAGGILVTVYAAPGERCWEGALGSWRPVVGCEGLGGYFELAAHDPLLSCLPARYRCLTLRLASTWYAAVVAVCQQNASFLQGWSMVYRLHELAGERLVLEGPGGRRTFIAPPRPEAVTEELLRRAGLGYRARTLAELARLLASNPDAGPEELAGVKGVGPYTRGLVELLAFGNLGARIVDRWVRGLAAAAYGVDPGRAEEAWLRRWGPWAGLASYHLTVMLDAEPLSRSLERLARGEVCPREEPERPTPLTMWRTWGRGKKARGRGAPT